MVSFTSKLLKSTDPDTMIQLQFKETRGNKTSKEKKRERANLLYSKRQVKNHIDCSPQHRNPLNTALFSSLVHFSSEWAPAAFPEVPGFELLLHVAHSLQNPVPHSELQGKKRYNDQTELITILGFLMIDSLGIPHYQLYKLRVV